MEINYCCYQNKGCVVDEEPRGRGILPFCIYGSGEEIGCQVRKMAYTLVVVVMVVGMGGGGWGVGYWSEANRIEPCITLIKATFKNHF